MGRDGAAPARATHVVISVPHCRAPSGRTGPARRRARSDRLRPFRQARRPDGLHGARTHRLAGALRGGARSARRHARGAGLGRPDRARPAAGRARLGPPRRGRQHRAAHGRPGIGRSPGMGVPCRTGRHGHGGADAARLPAPDSGAHAVPPESLRARSHRIGGAGRRTGGLRRTVPRRVLLCRAAPTPPPHGSHPFERVRPPEPRHGAGAGDLRRALPHCVLRR